MPITIEEDLVLGAQYTEDKNGPQLTRIFAVNGLTPGKHTLYIPGLSAGGVRIPIYTEAHPTVGGITVSHISAVPLMKDSRTGAKVTVLYRDPEITGMSEQGSVRIYDGNSQKTLQVDPKTGKPLRVGYDPEGAGGAGFFAEFDQINLPSEGETTILEYARIETGRKALDAMLNAFKYRRKLNSAIFLGADPYTVKCRGIGFDPIGQKRYHVRYQFEHNPDGWLYAAVFKDALTGKIPDAIIAAAPSIPPKVPDADEKSAMAAHNGIRYCANANVVDFNALSLPIEKILGL